MLDRRRVRLRVAAAVLAMVGAAASPARCETLADAIALAYATNPTLQAQRATLRATDEIYVQARANLGVQANVNGGPAYQAVHGRYLENQTLNGKLASESASVGLSLVQPIYSGGRNQALLTSAEAQVQAGRQNLRALEFQTVQQVIAAYVGVRRDEQVLAVERDTVLALERQVKQTEAEFGVRQVTRTDVDIALGRLASARSSVASAEAQLQFTRSQYFTLVGHSPATLAPEPDLDGLPSTVGKAFDIAEANNATLLAAQYGEEVAKARVSEARSSFRPSVSMRVDIGDAPIEPYNRSLGSQGSVGASLTVTQPLFTSGLNASQVRQALQDQNQAQFQTQAQRRTVLAQVAQYWTQLSAARQALLADAEAVRATQAAFYGTRLEQPFGLRLPIDVLNAQQEMNTAEINLLQHRYAEYTARSSLLVAMGMLDASLLVRDLDIYRPEQSFRHVKDIGAVPWESVIQAIDAVGSPGLTRPSPLIDDRDQRPPAPEVMPPPPPDAADVPAFKSSTEIMNEQQPLMRKPGEEDGKGAGFQPRKPPAEVCGSCSTPAPVRPDANRLNIP